MTAEESERLGESAAAFLGLILTEDSLIGVASNLRLLHQHMAVLDAAFDARSEGE